MLPDDERREEMTEEIHSCPFCGRGDTLTVYEHGGRENPDCFVQCDCCATTGPMAESKDLAIAAWNRRAPNQDQLGELSRALSELALTQKQLIDKNAELAAIFLQKQAEAASVLDGLPRYAEVQKNNGHFQLELISTDHKRALVYVDDLRVSLVSAGSSRGKEVKCEPCNGMGIQDGSGETCKACDGQGKIGYDAIFKAFDERMRDPLQKALYDADLAAKEANAKPSQSVNDLLRVDDYLGRNPGQSSNT